MTWSFFGSSPEGWQYWKDAIFPPHNKDNLKSWIRSLPALENEQNGMNRQHLFCFPPASSTCFISPSISPTGFTGFTKCLIRQTVLKAGDTMVSKHRPRPCPPGTNRLVGNKDIDQIVKQINYDYEQQQESRIKDTQCHMSIWQVRLDPGVREVPLRKCPWRGVGRCGTSSPDRDNNLCQALWRTYDVSRDTHEDALHSS